MLAKALLYLALVSTSFGFTAYNRFVIQKRCALISSSAKVANRAELSQKEFQLEELEDREECETELWLNDDGTITIGKSNGPKIKEYRGDWHILETATEEDRPFRMRLSRTYEAGCHTGRNQVGDIIYTLTREFHGNVEMVGDSISVSGRMHGIDDGSLLDCELGYFTMIDAVASEGIEGEK
mmetsp:Transcript_8672/g.18973  ORF Transcript_8672/g.18973 Transcript_8672/m.18973 type:complete len:182 (+) Transcript_8672:71-616(+)